MNTPNKIQRSMIGMIEGMEEKVPFIDPYTVWDAKMLRDYSTLCLFLPQRSGRTAFINMVARPTDWFLMTPEAKASNKEWSQELSSIRQPISDISELRNASDMKRIYVIDPNKEKFFHVGLCELTQAVSVVTSGKRCSIIVLGAVF